MLNAKLVLSAVQKLGHANFYNDEKVYNSVLAEFAPKMSKAELDAIEELATLYLPGYYSFAQRKFFREQGKRVLQNLGVYTKGLEWEL